jgi:hypothetical protein
MPIFLHIINFDYHTTSVNNTLPLLYYSNTWDLMQLYLTPLTVKASPYEGI